MKTINIKGHKIVKKKIVGISNLKLCKNGCNKPAYRDRSICRDCINADNRKRWQENKKYYRKNYLKPKHKVNCKYCNVEFETAIPNKKFCCEKHKHQWHYERRTHGDMMRAKAINRIHDKGKKRTGGYAYTDKEIRFIIKNYGKLNGIEIAAKLDRPVSGVRNKIRKLKDELLILPKNTL